MVILYRVSVNWIHIGLLKAVFVWKGYLDTISNRSHRVCYSKMRISNYRFAIETGRFRNIPRDERCCLFCKKQQQSIAVIEDEKHILYIVPCMNNIENNYMVAWTSYVQILRIQLNYLLNSDGPIVKAVARFF